MPHSDDFGLDDDETEFLALATQVEQSQGPAFQASPRPNKRRRVEEAPSNANGAHSERVEDPWSDDEVHDVVGGLEGHANRENGRLTSYHKEPDEDPDYYFLGEIEETDEQSKRHSKYKIHVPKNGGYFQDQIFTQTQASLDTSPSHFRGAVWKRPQAPPPPVPVFDERATDRRRVLAVNGVPVNGSKQTSISAFTMRSAGQTSRDSYHSDADLAARLQAEENSRGSRVNPQPPNTGNDSFHVSEELDDLPSDAFASSPPEKPSNSNVISFSSDQATSQSRTNGLRGAQQGLKQMTIFGQPATQYLSASQAATKKHAWPVRSRDEPPTHHKLDKKAMETWVYPTNLGATRDYQYNIVARSLFHNTLVALPTGLGKTFIAATVMLNYYRWTKDSQIVFMAPTKPLIAQQMEACYGIVGIPRQDTVLMTGETTPALRAEEWLEKRVFFMTPQTVINDLKSGIADPKKIVLMVVDEAHKATGGYAYTEVIKFLRRFNNSFRVQALTATPGSTVEAVQAVVDNLGIARVELRTEQSLDIRQYTHEKHTETQLFDYSDEQERIMDMMSQALRPVLEKLCTQNAYWSRDPMQLTAYGLTTARQKWQQSDAGRKAPMPVKGMVQAIFTVLASLAHSLSLLKFHGIVPFYSGCLEFQKSVESGQSKGKTATQIAQSDAFTKMMTTIRSWTSNVDFIGHPKLEYLREVVLNHFLDAGEAARGSDVPPSATRVMVFASYRDSTEEICRVLKRNEPMIRPHVFVGQAASKNSEGMDQKRQNAVIQDFKSGKYNTLVATSIGEEGLDIGTVDLIVCYDSSSSPIRMLQRIGRTGRRRIGNVVLLLMKGKEENDYAKAQDNYAYIQKTIADPLKYDYHDEQSPRILPKEVQPVVDKRMIEIPPENSQPIDLNEKARKGRGKGKLPKRPPKKFYMPDGVRTGFVNASQLESDDEAGGPSSRRATKKAAPKPRKLKQPIARSEPEPVALPFLSDVVLTSEQERDRERKYARTADGERDLVIRTPDGTRFPEYLRQPGPTKYVRHGRRFQTVANAMRQIWAIDGEKVEGMRDLVSLTDLRDAGSAISRLVDSTAGNAFVDEELPDDPVSILPNKSTRGRPKSGIAQKGTKASAAATNGEEVRSRAATKKRGPAPKARSNIQRVTSYGSAAAEGDESSPEPTPANMRIGTQGIDLGSRDTSGEEENDELDSELEDFIVGSDQPIEMASSSQRLPYDTQRGTLQRAPTKNGASRREHADSSASDDTDPGLASLQEEENDDHWELREVAAPTKKVLGARKRRVIGDSSDDE